MTSRVLPPEEWPRLAETEAETVWPLLDPVRAQVLVVEDGAQIVGCWVLMNVLHAECLWIAEAHRKQASVGRRLWTGLRRLVQAAGCSGVWTASASADVAALLAHVGATKVVGDHYVMGVR